MSAAALAIAFAFALSVDDLPEPEEGRSADAPAAPIEETPGPLTEAALAPPTEEAPPPPDFAREKRRMSVEDLEHKKVGVYFTGLPLINSDPDAGVGFGARAYFYDNGKQDSSLYAYTPYRHRLYGQAFATTNGYQFHVVDYDAPYVGDTPFRVRASVYFEKNIAANYFGIGEAALGKLRVPDRAQRFGSLDDYTDVLREVRPDGTAYTRYNQYILERPAGIVTLERDFLGGLVRGLVGVTVSHVNVRQWTGSPVAADAANGAEVDVPNAQSRLHRDCLAGVVVGCGGGWNNTLKLGIVYDTRDFEPDPNSGAMIELTGELSGKFVGSEYDWARVTFAPRAFVSPFPKLADLVLAGRFVTSVQSQGVPIFAMNQLSMTDVNRSGLGGLRTIRGFSQDRFVGHVSMLLNLEVRWTFASIRVLKKERFAFMLAPFFDVGRTFDSLSNLELARFRNGQGAGLRILWNQATVIVADYGVSREGSDIYINFNHPF